MYSQRVIWFAFARKIKYDLTPSIALTYWGPLLYLPFFSYRFKIVDCCLSRRYFNGDCFQGISNLIPLPTILSRLIHSSVSRLSSEIRDQKAPSRVPLRESIEISNHRQSSFVYQSFIKNMTVVESDEDLGFEKWIITNLYERSDLLYCLVVEK